MIEYGDGELSQRIIGCIIKVHKILGPGFLEKVYRKALMIELGYAGLEAETEKEVVVYYGNQEVGRHRLDILVENKVIIELKTVEDLSRAHYAQVRSYMRATYLDLAFLVNFSNSKADFRRIETA